MKNAFAMAMYYGADSKLFEYAKMMRKASTKEEAAMWQILTSGDFAVHKFRRQHPIARFIADFYCHDLRLVIEIDGAYHLRPEQMEYDDFRDEDMRQMGITVLRFTNEEIIHHTPITLNKLKQQIAQLNKH